MSQWLHKSTPSDPSNLIRWHHLQRHRFRKLRSPNGQWRQDCFYSLKLIIRVIFSTGTLLVDQSDCGLVGDPSTMQMSVSYSSLPEVLIVLPEDSGNLLLETGKFVSEIFQFQLYNSLLGVLLSKCLLKVTD